MSSTESAVDLAAASVAIIRAGQAPSGAYMASPTFSQYGYCWLRDGSFIALGMDAAGERESARRFHLWTARVVAAQAERVARIAAELAAGAVPGELEMLPTRYRLDGGVEETADEAWPNFQIDGYGTWLFALDAHLGGAALDELQRSAVRVAADYLRATWRLPCFDYWEEFGDRQHTSTLAAVAAGLRAAARLLDDPALQGEAGLVMSDLEERCVIDGAFVKGPEDRRVDASLLSLRTPFGLVDADDPRFSRTLARIREELPAPSGGLRRYLGDRYYGGSPWLLLTAWWGWHEGVHGDPDAAREAAEWVRQRAGEHGALPEQDIREPQFPEEVAGWEQRWGTVADPLLWSHAKYLLLVHGGRVATWS